MAAHWSGRVSPVAVVTGAARGIGAATVDALVAAGWQVVAVDRCADDPALDYPLAAKADLEEVADRHGGAVRTVVGDVRSASDMRAAVDEAVRHSAACRRPWPRPASSAVARRCGRPPTPSGTCCST